MYFTCGTILINGILSTFPHLVLQRDFNGFHPILPYACTVIYLTNFLVFDVLVISSSLLLKTLLQIFLMVSTGAGAG